MREGRGKGTEQGRLHRVSKNDSERVTLVLGAKCIDAQRLDPRFPFKYGS